MCGHETARPSTRSIKRWKSGEAQITDWIIGQTDKRKQSGKTIQNNARRKKQKI